MGKHIKEVVALTALIVPAWTAMAHHSNSSYQVDEIISLTGTVKEWQWVNPHTWIHIEFTTEERSGEVWMVEGGTPNVLLRRGLRRDCLARCGQRQSPVTAPGAARCRYQN